MWELPAGLQAVVSSSRTGFSLLPKPHNLIAEGRGGGRDGGRAGCAGWWLRTGGAGRDGTRQFSRNV